MGELSRVEDLLETGTEDTVNPLSRVEAILRGEDIKPLSRIEALLEEHSGGGKGGGTYNTDEDKIKNDAFMLHKDTNFIFTKVEKYDGLIYNWDFTKSLTDTINGEIAELKLNAVRDSEGVKLTGPGDRIYIGSLPDGFFMKKAIEIDIAKFDFKGDSSKGINLVNIPYALNFKSAMPLCWRSYYKWNYNIGNGFSQYGLDELNAISGKTIRLNFLSDKTELYLDGEKIGTASQNVNTYATYIAIGSIEQFSPSDADQSYDMTISGLRFYI